MDYIFKVKVSRYIDHEYILRKIKTLFPYHLDIISSLIVSINQFIGLFYFHQI